ncbi:MAG: hypothetical protein J6E46_09135 [Faecalicoccus sp.]|nr:hypothetical protein [Faecalicoccus sp.]
MFKKWIVFIISFLLVISGCSSSPKETESTSSQLSFRFATKEEGQELMLGNEEYYAGFSQNDLDYKFQKVNADMEEYQAFAKEQVLEFTEEEKTYLEGCFEHMELILEENGYTLPSLDQIILIKTTMEEENGVAGYTHGTQIYINAEIIDTCMHTNNVYMYEFLGHELFHCLTRCNPDFRADMYKLIHFTVVDHDYELPPSVFEYHISNPDVEHHNSYATFRINGEDIDCFTDFVTTKHFEKAGDQFFDVATTALVPIDGSDIYYTPEQAENFDEVFGKNTDYVVDPEECMADNFSYALNYGMKGSKGEGYPNPEIIEGIIDYLKKE